MCFQVLIKPLLLEDKGYYEACFPLSYSEFFYGLFCLLLAKKIWTEYSLTQYCTRSLKVSTRQLWGWYYYKMLSINLLYYIRVYDQILISKLFFNLNFIYVKLCLNIEPQHILYSLSNLISKATKFYHLLSTDIDDALLPSFYRHRLILKSLSLT